MARKLKKSVKYTGGGIIAAVAVALIVGNTIVPSAQYNHAAELMEQNEYEQAKEIYEGLGSFKDAQYKAEECLKGMTYVKATDAMNAGNYEEAAELFGSVSGFRDSDALKHECDIQIAEGKYNAYFTAGDYDNAMAYVQSERSGGLLQDPDGKLEDLAQKYYEKGDYDNTLKALGMVQVQSEKGKKLMESVNDSKASDANDSLYRELRDMLIDDSESVDRAKEILDELPEDYEEADDYRDLIDVYGDYIGTYYGPEALGNVLIALQDGTVYLESGIMTGEIAYPNLSAGYYNSEADNVMFTIASPETVTLIQSKDGEVIYESFVR